MFPWLVHLVGKRGRLSDIEYLAIKEFDGKIVSNEGSKAGSTGTIATLTANSGKDMYLAGAQIIVKRTSATTAANTMTIELQSNSVVKETASISFELAGTSVTGNTIVYNFVIKGIKVAATQVIRLELTAEAGDISVDGTLIAFEETTGASPAI